MGITAAERSSNDISAGSGATDRRVSHNNDSKMLKSLKRPTIFKPRLSCLIIICSAFLLASYLTPIWHTISADLGQYGRRLPRGKGLVTLFTTFDDNKEKYAIRLNVLRNWSLMRPEANLILFIQEIQGRYSLHKLVSAARSLGWAVVPVHRVAHSGKPFIKELYYAAMELYDTPLYGFVSGDIVFDDGLMKTLRLIKAELPFIGPTLVIGRRQNAFVDKNKAVYEYSDVAQFAEEHGQLYRVDALDYFITSRDYPWRYFAADVTVGRPAFDNYIAGIAVIKKMKVVDATASIVALHQNIAPLVDSGSDATVYPDRQNLQVIGNEFDFNKGSTQMASYETALTPTGLVDLRERKIT